MTPDQKEKELRLLFSQWLDGKGDQQAVRRLTAHAEDPELAGVWQSLLEAVPVPSEDADPRHAAVIDRVYNQLVAAQPELQPPVPVRRMRAWLKYAAAILLLVFAGGTGYYLFHQQHRQDHVAQAQDNVIPVNTNRAVLTLGNGTRIPLDSAVKGQLAQQPGAVIFKSDDGAVAYRKNDSLLAGRQAPEYNTLTTPRGGEHKLLLPDGTAVWLNAASSITFPTAFTGTVRSVSITGEAYFEVARNAAMPFLVKVNDATIEVLGTHFNISAYSDDPVTKTTLLEGAIRLVRRNESWLLKPGQQVQFGNDGGAGKLLAQVDVEEAVAWKNGTFDFRNQDIETVMNQIGRWYNMEIVYIGKKPEERILGMTSRSTDLATVLKSLELTSGVHFKIESGATGGQTGKIIVQP